MAFVETVAEPLAVILAAVFAAVPAAALAAERAAALAAERAAVRAAPLAAVLAAAFAEAAAVHAVVLAEVAAVVVTLVPLRAGRAGICSVWKNLKSGRKDAPKISPSLSQRIANLPANTVIWWVRTSGNGCRGRWLNRLLIIF